MGKFNETDKFAWVPLLTLKSTVLIFVHMANHASSCIDSSKYNFKIMGLILCIVGIRFVVNSQLVTYIPWSWLIMFKLRIWFHPTLATSCHHFSIVRIFCVTKSNHVPCLSIPTLGQSSPTLISLGISLISNFS